MAETALPASHLDGRVVVITGGAGGFGRLLAAGAAARGANVVAADVSEDALATVVDDIRGSGGDAIGVTADVTDLASMQALVAAALDAYGAVDVLVNNAGVMPLAFLADHAAAAEAWSRCIDVNIKGVLHGIIAAHDTMIERGRGHIVNISSIYGNHPVAGSSVYGASKAAVNFLSEVLRVESQGKIKVTTVRPTGVPSTGLGAGVVNIAAVSGILGVPPEALASGAAEGVRSEHVDRDEIGYAELQPSDLVDQILYAIDQPWGVVIGDITVRAAADRYVI